jgi:hypothetical protein
MPYFKIRRRVELSRNKQKSFSKGKQIILENSGNVFVLSVEAFSISV